MPHSLIVDPLPPQGKTGQGVVGCLRMPETVSMHVTSLVILIGHAAWEQQDDSSKPHFFVLPIIRSGSQKITRSISCSQ